jgi:hypothetical protein
MAQGPLAATVAVKSGAQAPMSLGVDNNLATQDGGANSKLNMTAANVIKASPGRLRKVVINGVVGTGGTLTINDCATTASAAAANAIMVQPGTIAPGTVIELNWPCKVGITISAVPTGGTPVIAASFD